MANVVVVSTANTIEVEFNDFASLIGYKRATFQKRRISFQEMNDESFVRIENAQGEHWAVSYNLSEDSIIIDLVDGVAPTSNNDLYNKLKALIA